MKRLVVTTSWDDGYPADVRLGQLLSKYGIAGTFYVPTRNSEGRPVLTPEQISKLAESHEIGGHSTDHVVLTQLEAAEADRQIADNKRVLEKLIGKPVRGFCYVRGKYNDAVVETVKRNGFDYARTVENFHATATNDRFRLPTTIQFYPHPKTTYLKNFAKGPVTVARALCFGAALASGDIVSRVERVAERAHRDGGYFHLWGHSWELDSMNLWPALNAVLAKLAAIDGAEFLTNAQAVDRFFGSRGC